MVLIFSTLGLPASCVLKMAVPILGFLSFYESSAYQFIYMCTHSHILIHRKVLRYWLGLQWIINEHEFGKNNFVCNTKFCNPLPWYIPLFI